VSSSKKENKKKCQTIKRKGAPMFDGEDENYDQLEIQWKTFVQVENLVSALGKQLDTDMPDSGLAFNRTTSN